MTTVARGFLATLCTLVLLFVAQLGGAQVTDRQREYFDEWQKTATRAEQVIDAQRASNAALENLRAEIAGYREAFATTRAANSARIKTLRSQIDALGPPPGDGEEEPADLATLRVSLNEQLDALRVPRVVAEEAHNRADGLIGEIDRIIRERQASKLLSRGPSPLNPEHWPKALRDVQNALSALVKETADLTRSRASREVLHDNLLPIGGLVLLGLVLLFRAHAWAERLGDYLRRFGGRGSGVWSFVVSLTKIFLPLAGVVAITHALTMSGMLGLRGTLIAEALPRWAATLLFFRWLADRLLPRGATDELVPVIPSRKRETRYYIALLAWMLVLFDAVRLFGQIESISEASLAVISFPGIVITSLILSRMQGIRLREASDTDEPGTARGSAAAGVVRLARKGAIVLSMAAPVLAAAGYVYAADAIIYPVVLTLALIAVCVVLQHFVTDLYGWLWHHGESARDSLFSVLAGFALALLSIPVLALIWGARVADLTEVWAMFMAGFQVGDARVSPEVFVIFAVVFGAGYMLTRLLQGGLRNSLLPKTGIDPGGQNALVSGTGYIGIFLASLVAIAAAGLDLSSLALVAGALSVGIGFGLQTIVSNFVSGIILLIERPISKGDWVEVNGLMGYVRDISVRSTRIETFDRTDVIVPNSDLISGTVTNYTRGNTIGRVIVPVGVAYSCDPRKVEKILLEIANAHPMVLANPAPSVAFQGFGASSMDFEIRAILRDVNWVLSVRSDMNYEIARRFAAEGIEIPFPQSDIWLRNPETLPGATRPAQTPAARPDTPGTDAKNDE
ncbi:MAG: DUF3772 domain-containing protein [Jhaorihella sp.]